MAFPVWSRTATPKAAIMEVGEQYRSDSAVKDPGREAELEAEATVIREIFLGPPVSAPAPATPAAPVQPLQRMLLHAAGSAGNRASAGLVRWFGH